MANLALDGLETQLKKYLGVTRAKKSKVHVVRYADDFVITANSPELLESEIRPWVEQFLSYRGLELSLEKTRVISIHEGFDFLGWNFRKYGEKLLIKPAKKNVQAFYQKVRTIISRHGGNTQEILIYRLAPVLRGWAQYHSPVVAKATFHGLDARIWYLLWRWAKRRHSKKGRQWVRKRYFHTIGNRNWEFACKKDNTGTESDYIRLKPLSVTPIIRHTKIKGAFNPFDPVWEKEGESLRMQRMLHSLRYRREIAGLYRLQKGQCLHCMHPITQETGWQEHHLEHILHGGKNVLDNRVLLHPECHDQIHTFGINLSKPARQKGLVKA
ncbi:group II intron maturase-specific domain-containing protein [Serratia fonticola]